MTARVRVVVLALVVVAAIASVRAAGTATVARANVDGGLTSYTIAWTSSAGGAVSGNAFNVRKGYLVSIRFVPASGGTQPSDLYDVTLVDSDGVDVLAGGGSDLSNSSASIQQWDPPLYQDGTRTLDLVVANAGNAKTGTVVLLIQQARPNP